MTGHFYLKNIKIQSLDPGTGKSPDQGPGYFLRTFVSWSCPGTVPVKYRIGTVQCVRNGRITVFKSGKTIKKVKENRGFTYFTKNQVALHFPPFQKNLFQKTHHNHPKKNKK